MSKSMLKRIATMTKHHNKLTEVDGKVFASGREAKRWGELKLLERSGAIKDLRWQVPYELAPSVVLDGRKKPALRYFCDFEYMEKNVRGGFDLVIEDCKSPHLRRDPVFRLKQHLLKYVWDLDILLT